MIVYQQSYFGDLGGDALDNGKLFIGVANQDPETHPLPCYFDAGLTIPAAQPLAISGGYVINNGARATVYTAARIYSLRVRDKNDVQIDYVAANDNADPLTDLAGPTGAALIGFGTRTVNDRLRDWPSVLDWGAKGDNATDNTSAFQQAFAEAEGRLMVPIGDYLVQPGLNFPPGFHLMGQSRGGATGPGSVGNYPASRIIFGGNGAAGLKQANTGQGLFHGSMTGLIFDTEPNAEIDWIMDFHGLLNFDLADLGMENRWMGGGCFRTRKIGDEPTWLNSFQRVQTRSPDNGTAYNFDIDCTDSGSVLSSYTGGRGAIYRGHGNFHSFGDMWQRGGDASLILSKETLFQGLINLTGSSFDASFGPGILIDLSVSPGGLTYFPVIVGNSFRNPGEQYDIVVQPHATDVIQGGIIVGNAFSVGSSKPWLIDTTKFTVEFGLNSFMGAANQRDYRVMGTGTMNIAPRLVADLPTAEGTIAYVINATSSTPNDLVVAGGSNHVFVKNCGGVWKVM
ncbi:hypothetical protein HNO88_000312 [Novosphingobium chloroacetimidivorans]|uniref:Rhamnogalacturonase A/B/Epimerase-like pectate lyase domain-containing protein n=1 Tax=Novosphingobium chloroacetimidivorans TaxID=1428314 RepID=A0A7W7NVC9_9SPHN|nr:glycosyl hydrolase family 28-related protein [Novosphingobium chloroacetimidivorans]MBB4857015.1 hypothetical protein [Novosphingobium chloroacetimidivorans]